MGMNLFIESPVSIETFLAAAEKALPEVCPGFAGELSICEYADGEKLPLTAKHIGDTRPLLLIRANHKYSVIALAIDLCEFCSAEARHIQVSFLPEGGIGDPGRLLLAAACALALARLTDADIDGISPAEFIDNVKAKDYPCPQSLHNEDRLPRHIERGFVYLAPEWALRLHALPAAAYLQTIQEIISGARVISPDFYFLGEAEMCQSRAWSSTSGDLQWAHAALLLFEQHAREEPEHRENAMWRAMKTREIQILRHGPLAGDFVLDPEYLTEDH